VSTTSRKTLKAIKNERTYSEVLLNKKKAWENGRNPKITIATGLRKEGFKKVPANQLWGDPRTKWFYSQKREEKDDSLFPVKTNA